VTRDFTSEDFNGWNWNNLCVRMGIKKFR
jgi:hypothetical protein